MVLLFVLRGLGLGLGSGLGLDLGGQLMEESRNRSLGQLRC
jgi:hypothetical protein